MILAYDDEQHPPAYCRSPSPLSSPIPCAGASTPAEEENIGQLPTARNQSEKFDLIAKFRGPSTHPRLLQNISATTTSKQEHFRPEGYTSSAPWLHQSGYSFGSVHTNNSERGFPPEHRRATTGSGYPAHDHHHILDASHGHAVDLPNPYAQTMTPDIVSHFTAGSIHHTTPRSGTEMRQVFSNPASIPRRHLRYIPPEAAVPEVAISESRLILDGIDVYADMNARSMSANSRAPSAPGHSRLVSNSGAASSSGYSSNRGELVGPSPRVLSEAGTIRPSPLGPVPPSSIVTTQPSPHPEPLVPTMKPLFVRRDTPAGGVLRAPQSRKGNINPKNVKSMAFGPDGRRDWSSDLCMFCDHNLGACLSALACPCIVYAQNKARLEHLNLTETPLKAQLVEDHRPRSGRGWATHDCAVHACLTVFCMFGWAMQISNRAAVRRRYNIEGDLVGDCAAALCCSSCELAQESREIELEERCYYEN